MPQLFLPLLFAIQIGDQVLEVLVQILFLCASFRVLYYLIRLLHPVCLYSQPAPITTPSFVLFVLFFTKKVQRVCGVIGSVPPVFPCSWKWDYNL